jgi:hypothetical protein
MSTDTTTATTATTEVPRYTQRIRDAFNINRSKMTMVLARELGVPEAEVIRALPTGCRKSSTSRDGKNCCDRSCRPATYT